MVVWFRADGQTARDEACEHGFTREAQALTLRWRVRVGPLLKDQYYEDGTRCRASNRFNCASSPAESVAPGDAP